MFFYFLQLLGVSFCFFVEFGVYNSSSCDGTSFVQKFILPPFSEMSQCFEGVFPDDTVMLTYFDGSINKTLQYQSFSAVECNGNVKKSRNISFGSCYFFESSEMEWYFNVTITEEFPYERTNLDKHWIKSERFEDEVCQNPVEGSKYDEYGSIVLTSSDIDDGSQAFCTDENIILSVPNYDDFLGYCSCNVVQVIPRELESECVPVSPFIDLQPSRKVSCFTDDELETTYIPDDTSFLPYVQKLYSYQPNCTTNYRMNFRSLDLCDDLGAKRINPISEPNRIYVEKYEDLACEESIDRIFIFDTFSEDEDTFYSTECQLLGYVDDEQTVGYYTQTVATVDAFDYDKVAFIRSNQFPCGSDLKKRLKDPTSGSYVEYLDPEYCISTQSFTALKKIGSSVKAHCRGGGDIETKIWEQSEDCTVGSYQSQVFKNKQICESTELDSLPNTTFYDYLLCILRFCGEYSEVQTDLVCNGRGSCVENDLCDCEDGYTGSLCESWECYDIDKDESNVCYGRGECSGPDSCVCPRGYSGEICDVNSWWTFAILFILFGGFTGPLLIIYCGCFLLFICVCFWSLCFVCCASVCGVSGYNLYQRIRINRFEQLEGFEIILKEQKIEKDQGTATLKINKKLFEINYDEIDIGKIIGEGGSDAVVFRGTWKGTVVAFKCFRTRKICSSQERFNTFEAEVNLLINLNHPNVIRFYGATLNPPRVGIVMEYCENGEILDYIMKHREEKHVGYPLEDKIRMSKEIIAAIEYIHSRNIIHRDIKSENVLLDASETCKLMDFGISKQLAGDSSNKNTQRIGTNVYMAPEVLTSNYDHRCDSFSFAILLWVILAENPLPYGEGVFKVEFRVANDATYRPDISATDKSLQVAIEGNEDGKKFDWIKKTITRCWDHDPSKRFTFSQLELVFENEDPDMSFPGDEEVEDDDGNNNNGDQSSMSPTSKHNRRMTLSQQLGTMITKKLKPALKRSLSRTSMARKGSSSVNDMDYTSSSEDDLNTNEIILIEKEGTGNDEKLVSLEGKEDAGEKEEEEDEDVIEKKKEGEASGSSSSSSSSIASESESGSGSDDDSDSDSDE